MAHCDGCGKDRRDVVSCGRDANGAPDSPDLCYPCRWEGERGMVFDKKRGGYVAAYALMAEAEREALATEPRPDLGGEDEIPF